MRRKQLPVPIKKYQGQCQDHQKPCAYIFHGNPCQYTEEKQGEGSIP